ncbi:MAG: WYL domain-containing protein [candidate division KSB1 bacterium]|nr:WYL domain-containing protein [candidate division KSB1 bacterium]MDZ7274618.1 WYL domain-containing protein [candidate division KSB1 bacterium]MDZ7285443.1 WYL domain-containing protein [candidate division KSB1 bacterium]MDZ7298475.1 WYL domain-containing protein [candidate division KSB1 bacterium]MDZ7306959.1 WYL domain-containing protein [candidate division KSB1 bacterium]
MKKSIRLLKIWQLCRHKRMMTAPRLARMCNVDERTIYRDIQALTEMGIAIACEGGYRVINEDVLPQLNLTRPEQLVVTLALKNLPLNLDKELEKIASDVLNKLLDQPVESHGITLETAKIGPLKPGVFARLQRAIDEHRLVTFIKYRKLIDEEEHNLRLEPYHLRFMDRAWYLVAWSFKRDAFRTYRLDRIDKLRLEKETFTPRPFDADQYFRGAFGAVVDAPARLRVRFTGLAKEIVKKDGRFPPAELHEENDALILDKTIQGEILWLRWLLGFGGEAEILEPVAMREKAVAMLRAGLARYGS